MEENKSKKRKEYVTKIGPLMKEALEKQKKKVEEATYGCVNSSDYEAGEIIAKKISSSKIL